MVTTQRQIIEKMLGRRLVEKEAGWLEKTSHVEMLMWAHGKALEEGRKPGYSDGAYLDMHRRKIGRTR